MTAYERVLNRLDGKPVDKIPNLNILMTFAAKEIGVPYSVYATDYKKLVEGNIVCAEKYGIDCVCAISDSFREAHAFGANIIMPEDAVPYCKEHILGEETSVSLLKDFDVYGNERTLDRIKAIDLFKTKVGNDYPIIGWVEGVFAESANLRGVNAIMMDLAIEEDYLEELFAFVFKKECEFIKAQVTAGAHIIGIGNAVASLIGPTMYRKYAYDYDKKLIDYVHACGAMSKLHICGDITPLLPQIKTLNANIVDVDYEVDFELAVNTFSGIKTSVSGNIDPVRMMMNSTQDEVKQTVLNRISLSDNTTIISSGCEIPRDTPQENMLIMDKSLK